jgi:Flp pilus assembly protein TadG
MNMSRSRSRREEGGFVLVWMAMVIILLLAVAALAVDLVHAYEVGQKAQNAADAAALAGAIQLPNGTPGCPGAQSQAQQLSTQNGFTDGADGATVTATCTGPNEMTVDVKSKFGTFFAKAIGFPTLTVHRHAVAQYDAGVRMGSPANNIGNVAECPPAFNGNQCLSIPANGAQNLWAQVEGTDSQSGQGNALTTHNCNQSTDECKPDNTNNQEDVDGEFYTVHNDGGPLNLWIYDAGFVATQQTCGVPAGPDPLWNDGNPSHMFAFNHYGPNAYCPGDTEFSNDAQPFRTKYDVLAPGDPDDTTTPLCSTGWINGYTKDLSNPLEPAPEAKVYFDPVASQYWHQWQPLGGGAIPSASTAGDYRIRVQADGSGAVCGLGPAECGVNNFSLIATHGTNTPSASTQLAIFAPQKLPLTAITQAGLTQDFYVARVLPSSRERTLEISFFDLGDPGSGTLSLVAGPGVDPKFTAALSNPASNICRYIDPGSLPVPSFFPFPTPDSNPPWQLKVPCTLGYNAAGAPPATWNGRWVVFHIRLPKQTDPDGWDCPTGAGSTPQDCWIKVKIKPNAANHDATTWSARILGAPARLTG